MDERAAIDILTAKVQALEARLAELSSSDGGKVANFGGEAAIQPTVDPKGRKIWESEWVMDHEALMCYVPDNALVIDGQNVAVEADDKEGPEVTLSGGSWYLHVFKSDETGEYSADFDDEPTGSREGETAKYNIHICDINEKQLIIGETTYGGREELHKQDGAILDYGSLIYIALERCSTAREAIALIYALTSEYGYCSEGESFSIADKDEVWVMDLIGKGNFGKGIVYVARRVPDGFICAHANQSRITTFPLDKPDECLYSPDVISFARERGYFSGEDREFSFADAYNPLDFSGARGCDARAWSAFNILCDGVFTWRENGVEVSKPSGEWLRYAMGYDLDGEMPLFVKPQRKVSPKDVADVMRDHYEGTPMDMTKDIGAGGNACPYRWRPMDFEWGGKTYCNERAIATQQTGFWFVAEARPNLPKEAAALVWFGCDDAATSYLTPIYVSTFRVPECLKPGNGDILHYSPTSQFWMCNRVAQACYKMYDRMAPFVRAEVMRSPRSKYFAMSAHLDAMNSGVADCSRVPFRQMAVDPSPLRKGCAITGVVPEGRLCRMPTVPGSSAASVSRRRVSTSPTTLRR